MARFGFRLHSVLRTIMQHSSELRSAATERSAKDRRFRDGGFTEPAPANTWPLPSTKTHSKDIDRYRFVQFYKAGHVAQQKALEVTTDGESHFTTIGRPHSLDNRKQITLFDSDRSLSTRRASIHSCWYCFTGTSLLAHKLQLVSLLLNASRVNVELVPPYSN